MMPSPPALRGGRGQPGAGHEAHPGLHDRVADARSARSAGSVIGAGWPDWPSRQFLVALRASGVEALADEGQLRGRRQPGLRHLVRRRQQEAGRVGHVGHRDAGCTDRSRME